MQRPQGRSLLGGFEKEDNLGNLFLGFPVARAKIADMISTSAPPALHHAQHENGGSDEIDATGLTGAGGGALFPLDIYLFTAPLESLSGYNQTVNGSASIVLAGDGITLDTGATANSEAYLDKQNYVSTTISAWSKSRQFEAHCYISSDTSKTGTFWLISGNKSSSRHIGFKILNGVLYGSVGNGSAETTTALQTLGASAFTAQRTLKAVFTATVDCKFYVDGVLLGTITTGLPTGTTSANQLFFAYVENTGVAQDKFIIISSMNTIIKP